MKKYVSLFLVALVLCSCLSLCFVVPASAAEVSASMPVPGDPGWYKLRDDASLLDLGNFTLNYAFLFYFDYSAFANWAYAFSYGPDYIDFVSFNSPLIPFLGFSLISNNGILITQPNSFGVDPPIQYTNPVLLWDDSQGFDSKTFEYVLLFEHVNSSDLPLFSALFEPCEDPFAPGSSESGGIYGSIETLISDAFYGQGTELTGWQELVVTVLATAAIVFVFAVPFIVVFFVIKLITGR